MIFFFDNNSFRKGFPEINSIRIVVRRFLKAFHDHGVKATQIPRNQLGQNPKYVFTYQGKSVWQVNTKSWRGAVRRTGLEDFRWHDLRHTWASWHVQAGTPTSVLQEMGPGQRLRW